MSEEIYKQNIIEHYKNPHNLGALSGYTHKHEGVNTNCGDKITMYLKIKKGIISDISFEGVGCAISQSATSMLTDKVKGLKIEEVKTMTPGAVYNMLGIKINPGRTKCALLSYQTLTEILNALRRF